MIVGNGLALYADLVTACEPGWVSSFSACYSRGNEHSEQRNRHYYPPVPGDPGVRKHLTGADFQLSWLPARGVPDRNSPKKLLRGGGKII